ncbi:MAG: glycosyl hydrolase-related protein, partial [Bacteroidota bacterium]
KHRCFSIDGGTASAVMMRAVVSNQLVQIRDGKRAPHHRPAPGRDTFTYAMLPHEKDWAAAKWYRAGWNLNYPLIPVTVDDAVTAKTLPASDRFIKLDSSTDSLILTVFKKAEDNDDLIVRFYETEGRNGSATFNLPGEEIEETWLCDLRERPVRKLPSPEAVEYGPFEIVTLRMKRGGKSAGK